MEHIQEYEVGRHRISIATREGVGPPTPYTQLLADHIPEISEESVVDIGTGSGFLAIVAMLQGAASVFVTDTNAGAIFLAFENAERNGVRDGLVHLPIGNSMIPLPAGQLVDLVISNPAQLPLPEPDRADSPYYAGRDGRRMIEAVIRDTPARLSLSGRLFMTHNSMADLPETMRLIEETGMEARVVAERLLEFRPFINRGWLDEIGGTERGLYTVRDGRAFETLSIIEAGLRK